MIVLAVFAAIVSAIYNVQDVRRSSSSNLVSIRPQQIHFPNVSSSSTIPSCSGVVAINCDTMCLVHGTSMARDDSKALRDLEKQFQALLNEIPTFYDRGEINSERFCFRYRSLEKEAMTTLSSFFCGQYPESESRKKISELSKALGDELEKLLKAYDRAVNCD